MANLMVIRVEVHNNIFVIDSLIGVNNKGDYNHYVLHVIAMNGPKING